MKKNLYFYLKNEWRELFEKNSNGVPISLPLSFHDLSLAYHFATRPQILATSKPTSSLHPASGEK